MNKNIYTFFKSFFFTLFLITCFTLAIIGIGKSYEKMVFASFGKEKSAVQIFDGGIRILDFEISY